MRDVLTIGVLAKAADTKVETIRYYERIGLLPKPMRTSSNYRAYGAEHLARLRFVRRARQLGFSIGAVRGLLNLSDQMTQDCTAVGVIARIHLNEVKQKIAELTGLNRELHRLIRQCERGSVAQCRIIEALSEA